MKKIREVKEIVVVAENKVEYLARIAEALGSAGINIEAINAYEKQGEMYLRFLTPDVESSKKVLKIQPGRIIETKAIVVKLMDRPGELGKLSKKIARALVSLESLYIVKRDGKYTDVAIKPKEEDYDKVVQLLR